MEKNTHEVDLDAELKFNPDYVIKDCDECGRELTKEDFENGNVFYCDNCGGYFCSDCILTVKYGETVSDFYCPHCSPKVRKVSVIQHSD